MQNQSYGSDLNGKVSKNADYLKEYIAKYQQQFDQLSEREIQLITLVSKGLNNTNIANHLDITKAELADLRTRLYQKLSLQTDSEYIKFALAFGLISF